MLAVRKVAASSVTAAATFRLIEATSDIVLLIDEFDTVDPEKAGELRAVVNAGHCKLDAYVIRTVPVNGELVVRSFSCWAPTVVASNKALPVTWVDRSITVRLKRKPRGERVDRLRDDVDLGFDALASRAARWAADNLDALRGANPQLPAVLNDRQADNWRMLVAIADRAGGDWGAARARRRRRHCRRRTWATARRSASCCCRTCGSTSSRSGQSQNDRATSLDLAIAPRRARGEAMGRVPPRLVDHAEPAREPAPAVRDLLADDQGRGAAAAPAAVRLGPEGRQACHHDRQGLHARGVRGGVETLFFSGPPLSSRHNVTSHGNRGFRGGSESDTSKSDVSHRKRPKATATATCVIVTAENPPSRENRQKRNGNGPTAFTPTDDWQEVPDGAVCLTGSRSSSTSTPEGTGHGCILVADTEKART